MGLYFSELLQNTLYLSLQKLISNSFVYKSRISSPHFFWTLTLPYNLLNETNVFYKKNAEPGSLEFSKPSYVVREGMGKATLYVNRVNGADGAIKVSWKTKDMSATAGKDYISGEGVLVFSHGETQKTIDILILATDVS